RDVLLLSGDQLYRMDFAELIRGHRSRRADVTLALAPVTRDRARRLGVVRLDAEDRLTDLVEKPKAPAQLDALRTPAEWLARHGLGGGRDYLANMGIYAFTRQALIDLLKEQTAAVDLVREVLPRFLRSHRILGHVFAGYWEDLGTIRAYHEANLALAGDD